MTILIADDSSEVRSFFTMLLASYHRVLFAQNGLEALAILRAEKVDFLITDYHMPQLDGVELIEQIVDENINVPNVLLISSDLPSAFVLARLNDLSRCRFRFVSAEKNSEGFELIKGL